MESTSRWCRPIWRHAPPIDRNGSQRMPPGFFGAGLPGIHISPEFTEFVIRQCLDCSARATVQFFLTGFAADLRDQLRMITVPALIVHGDHDIQAPLELCGRKTARLVPQNTLRVYENAAHGLFVTHADRLNADLLAFAGVRRSDATASAGV
jgi:non-heme chloroperoxidase